MKRIFILITIFALLFTQLAACFKKTDTNLWVNGKKLDRVTLTIYLPPRPGYYISKYGSTLLYDVLKELNKKAEEELNVKIKIANLKVVKKEEQWVAVITPDTQDALKGNACDMLFINKDSSMQFSLKSLYDAGMIKDLSDLFVKYAPKYCGLFSRDELDTVSYDGKILAIPSYNLPGTKRVHAIVRESLLKKYKIKSINSYEEYESFLEIIRKNEPGMIPTKILPSTLEMFAEASGYATAVNEIGIQLVYRSDDSAMKLMDWKQTPEYKNVLETLRRWRTKGYYNMIDVTTPDYSKYASVMGYKGDAEGISESLMQSTGISAKFTEFDLYPGKASQRTFDPGNIVVFNAKTKNTERALTFINWLMNDREAYNLFEFGIKGKDYKLDSKGQIKLLFPDEYDENAAYNNIHKIWSLKNDNLGIQDNFFLKNQAKYIKSRSKYFPHTGFKSDLLKLGEIFKNFDSDIRYKFEARAFKGDLTDADIDDFLKEQRKITDPLVAGVQAQLDEWKNNSKR